MNHYTDKDMTSDEFILLLQDRLKKGESIDGYSYTSTNGTKVIIKNSRKREIVDWIVIVLINIGVCWLLSL